MGESALLFGRGLLRHFVFWVPGVFLGLLELVQREIGKPITVPVWVFWLVFGAGVLLAAFLTFHDLRKATSPDSSRGVRRAIGNEIGTIINEGELLPELGLRQPELNEQSADWWNSAGVFVEVVLGAAERHIISEPKSSAHFDALITAHCNLLRGTLQRLPAADLRVGTVELQEAIAVRRAAVSNRRS